MHMGSLAFMLLQSPAPSTWQRLRDVVTRIWDYAAYELPIGNFKVSLTGLATGVIVLVVALYASRSVSRVIERRIAKRQYIDPGIRYTVARLVQYLIITVGVLYALKAAFAVDLTSIAVIFTALSVGIGFGLQYLAADIAAGFILLFERPIRVGDRVTIGTDEGDVHSINLRTTVVMTNDRIAVIVPNSRLVRDSLINWSYGDPRARIAIPVSVNPSTNVDLVTRTLLESAEKVDDIIVQPAPKAQLLKFGNSSLDFRLLIWTNKPRAKMQIRSDVNYRIERLFREKGIELASPHVNVRLHGGQLSLTQDTTPTPADGESE